MAVAMNIKKRKGVQTLVQTTFGSFFGSGVPAC